MEKLFDDIDQFLGNKRSESLVVAASEEPENFLVLIEDVTMDSQQRLDMLVESVKQERALMGSGFDVSVLIDIKRLVMEVNGVVDISENQRYKKQPKTDRMEE